MARIACWFLIATAPALAITAVNAAPSNAALNEGITGPPPVVQTHMCHLGCRYGPMHIGHRHRVFSCAETQCIFDWDWGRLWGREPVFYKRRH